MRLVARYTLVLGAAIAIALTAFAYVRANVERAHRIEDMRRAHRAVGHLLQASLQDIWGDVGTNPSERAEATRQTVELIAESASVVDATRFEWDPAPRPGAEVQGAEGEDFVSRFPVDARGVRVGTLVAREPLAHIEESVRSQLWLGVATIATILVICTALSLLMGKWLVGRPVSLLVEQARRIGHQDFTPGPMLNRRDELGALARELQRTAAELADSLARRATETEARVAAIEQLRHSDRLATVGRLAAGIAHELGTPLSIVGGHAQMIAGGEVTGDRALASARAIDHEVARMGKIVRQLLDFARRKGPEGTTCDPTVVARRCASLLEMMAEGRGVTWQIHETEPSPRAKIDEDSLQQVLTNLMVNAIQAMPTGGTLAITVARVTAAATPGATPRACVRVDVSDTGTGISPEVKAHIFEPFFTTKQPGEGTGLGLAVVHGIIVDHGGWIDVATSERGTTFSLFFEEATS